MYSFAERPDTHVLDEPLYGHYLRHQPTAAIHPGAEEVIEAQPLDAPQVVKHLIEADFGREVLVAKQMTHHLVEMDWEWMLGMDNVLLIRDPARILASFAKEVEQVTARDIGYPLQVELAEWLEKKGALSAIIDSKRLLQNPVGQLKALCEKLGLPFTDSMLSWQPGGRKEDGVWSKHWYASVHTSTGFSPYTEKEVQLSPKLQTLAIELKPLYENLLNKAL